MAARAIAGLLQAAANHFGLEIPVMVEYAEMPFAAYYRREDAHHLIVVNPELSPGEMSRSLYHELKHAQQCEQQFGGNGEAFHRAVANAAICAAEDGQCMTTYERDARTVESLDEQIRLAENDSGGYEDSGGQGRLQ